MLLDLLIYNRVLPDTGTILASSLLSLSLLHSCTLMLHVLSSLLRQRGEGLYEKYGSLRMQLSVAPPELSHIEDSICDMSRSQIMQYDRQHLVTLLLAARLACRPW